MRSRRLAITAALAAAACSKSSTAPNTGGNNNGGGSGTPAPVVIDSNVDPRFMVTDGQYLYWVNTALSPDGIVARLALTGGPVDTLASGLDAPSAIAVDTGYVYWIDAGDSAYGSVKRVPKGGGTVSQLASGYSSGISTSGLTLDYFQHTIAVANGTVYVPGYSLESASDTAHVYGIVGVATSGGAASWAWSISQLDTSLAPPEYEFPCSTFATDGQALYWVGTSPENTSNYICDTGDAALKRLDLTSKTLTVLADSLTPTGGSGNGDKPGIAVANGKVYWVELDGLWAIDTSGGTRTQLHTGVAAGAVAVDSAHVFWTGGELYDVPVGGGTTQQIGGSSTSYNLPMPVVLPPGLVVWGQAADGLVLKLTRP